MKTTHLLRVTDISSPSCFSHIRVDVLETKGETVRVEAHYPEALSLAPRGFIPAAKLLPLGSVKEGWEVKA